MIMGGHDSSSNDVFTFFSTNSPWLTCCNRSMDMGEPAVLPYHTFVVFVVYHQYTSSKTFWAPHPSALRIVVQIEIQGYGLRLG